MISRLPGTVVEKDDEDTVQHNISEIIVTIELEKVTKK